MNRDAIHSGSVKQARVKRLVIKSVAKHRSTIISALRDVIDLTLLDAASMPCHACHGEQAACWACPLNFTRN
jgi:hypothetical protein